MACGDSSPSTCNCGQQTCNTAVATFVLSLSPLPCDGLPCSALCCPALAPASSRVLCVSLYCRLAALLSVCSRLDSRSNQKFALYLCFLCCALLISNCISLALTPSPTLSLSLSHSACVCPFFGQSVIVTGEHFKAFSIQDALLKYAAAFCCGSNLVEPFRRRGMVTLDAP